MRCAAQLLQFYTLQGSIVLATRAGHQVNSVPRPPKRFPACCRGDGRKAAELPRRLRRAGRPGHIHHNPANTQALWSNLVARMQRLLDACLLPPSNAAQLCQELADTLAMQAAAEMALPSSGVAAGAGGGAAASAPSTARAARSPAQLLQCAEALLATSAQLVGQAVAGAQQPDGEERAQLDGWLRVLHADLVEVGCAAKQRALCLARVQHGGRTSVCLRSHALGSSTSLMRAPLNRYCAMPASPYASAQVRLRWCEATLRDGGAADALAGALEVLQAASAARDAGGAEADRAAAAGTHAAKLAVAALLAQGQQGAAAEQLSEWLVTDCPDARAAAAALGTFAAGCSLAAPGAAEQLCSAAAAAAKAFPGRHDPAMAVAECLLAPQAGSPSPGDSVVLQLLADDDVADAIKKVRLGWGPGVSQGRKAALSGSTKCCAPTSAALPPAHAGARRAQSLPRAAVRARRRAARGRPHAGGARPARVSALLQPAWQRARAHRAAPGRVLSGAGPADGRAGAPIACGTPRGARRRVCGGAAP